MKKILLFLTMLLLFTAGDLLAFFIPSQGNYRWRNDDGNEETATWRAEENDSIIVSDEGNIRLRIEMYNNTGGLAYYSPSLLYANISDTVWSDLEQDESVFVFSASDYLTHGDSTSTALLTKYNDTDSSFRGIVITSSDVTEDSIDDGVRKEYEFCFKVSPDAVFDSTYLFMFVLGDYAILPKVILKKPVLTVTADSKTRLKGTENPVFTLSYSGFVDGDGPSVIDDQPDVTCTANASSPSGEYDIIPSGGSDNKYELEYVNGTLTINETSGLKDHSQKFNVYPNPVQNFLYVEGDITGKETVKISDMSGKLIMETVIKNHSVDLSTLSSGLYLIEIDQSVFKINKK